MTADGFESSRWIHHREQIMGTVVTFDVETGPNDQAAAYLSIARARTVLRRADAVFSTWRAQSPINRIRRGEITCTEAPPEVADVFEACRVAKEISGGWFDPWAMPGGVDPTGYVKGWAAQRALEALIEGGAIGAIVNAAGDVATYRTRSSERFYRIGIADPSSPGRLVCAVEIEGAIATSGTYERGSHLIDPHSGAPCSRVASASVTGPDLGLADALATALAVAGGQALPTIDALRHYEGFVIDWDGNWNATASFPFASDMLPEAPRSTRST